MVSAWQRLSGYTDPKYINSRCPPRNGSTRPGTCTVLGWRCVAQQSTNGANYPLACRKRRAHIDWVQPF